MAEAYVNSTIHGGVEIIEFYHPQSNSLPSHILDQIANAIEAAGTNDDVRCVLLKSGGDRAFCAGASFDELVAIDNDEKGLDFFTGFAKVINAVRLCPKFVIGRVQGKAVGGGVGVASAVDYCFATKHAAIKLSELAIGIGPFVVGPAVERKMGKSAFTELAIDASEWRSAEWAFDRGLYNSVSDTAEAMDESINAFLTRVEKYSPDAMKELKKVFWEGTENWGNMLVERAKISGRLVLSDFTKNAINSFKTK
ncbi:MAG: enoyl-CoA hydratase/isomerase family protein [Salibacteraceae bacterium]